MSAGARARPDPCESRQARRFNCQATLNADARRFTRADREGRHHKSDVQPADFPDPREPATWETRSTSHVATLSTKLPARLNLLLRATVKTHLAAETVRRGIQPQPSGRS